MFRQFETSAVRGVTFFCRETFIMCNPLPTFVVLFLFVGALPAQENSDPRATTGDPTQSDFGTLLSQAESGDREAQYRVAQLYAFPEDRLVPKNDAASRDWMLKSAEQGYAPAQARLGEMELSATGDRGKAEMWLRRAAEQDNSEGQTMLGVTYENGKFGRKDYQEAFKWLMKAAEKGDPDAEVSLGEMYEDGKFVSQNYVLAAKWYRKAAEHSPDPGGAGKGRNQLGMLYEDGLGVPKNLVLAYMWYSLTQFQGNLKEVECHMTRAQIAQARKMAFAWLQSHPEEHFTVAQQNGAKQR
jgi:TPR repeat protein